MSRFNTKVQVNKPVEHTFQSFLDETLMEHWISGFKGIEILKGEPRTVESLYKMLIHFNGQDMEVFQKLLEVELNKRVHIEMEHPELILFSDIYFNATGLATEVLCISKIVGKKMHVKLAMPFVKSLLEQRNNKDYRRFKKVVEDL